MAAEPALIDLAVRGAIERETHVLELENGIDRFPGQHFGRVLIHQVVATLDGVEHVPFPVVFFSVAQSCADSALSGARVRARRVQLADDSDVGLARHLDRRHESRTAGADNDRIEPVIPHGADSSSIGR